MALDFDGTTGYVELPIGTIPNMINHTITAWCNLDDISLAGGNRSLVNMNNIASPNSGISLYIKGEDDLTGGRIGNIIEDLQFNADAKITINNWHLASVRGKKVSGKTINILGSWESENTAPSHSTTPTGNDRLLIFFVCNEVGTPALGAGLPVTSVTYGGTSMTFLSVIELVTAFTARIEMWILDETGIASSSGQSFVVVFPGSSDVAYHHVFLDNVNQLTPTGTIETESESDGSLSIVTSSSILSSSGEMIVACNMIGNGGVTFTSDNGFTEGTEQDHFVDIDGSATSTTLYKTSTGIAETPGTTTPGPVNRNIIMGVEINQSYFEPIELLGSWESGITHLSTPSGSNRLLVFFGSNETSTDNEDLSTVTYGTESLSLVGRIEVDDDPNAHIEMWVLKEAEIATASSTTFVPTWASGPTDPVYTHAFFNNVDQTISTGTTETATKLSSFDPDRVGLEGVYTTSTATISYTNASPVGSNRLFIAYFTHNDTNVDSTISGTPTYGTQTLTLVGTETVGSGPYNRVYIYTLDEAGIQAAEALANTTVAWTWTPEATPDNQVHASAFFINVDQVISTGGFVSNSIASADTDITTSAIIVDNEDMTIAVAASGQTTSFTPNNSFIEGFDTTNSTSTVSGIYKDSNGASQIPSVTQAASGSQLVMAAVRINGNPNVGRVGSFQNAGFIDIDQSPIDGTITEAGIDNTDRILIAVMTSEANGVDSPFFCSTAAWGGESMTNLFTNAAIGTSGRRGSVSVFYLLEAGIQAASGSTLSTTWNKTPTGDRREAAAGFFININQSSPFNEVVEADSATGVLAFSTSSAVSGDMHVMTAWAQNTAAHTGDSLLTDGLINHNLFAPVGFVSQILGIATAESDGTVGQLRSMTKAGATKHGGVAFTLLKIPASGSDTISTATISSSNGDVILAGTVCGNTGDFTANNDFIEGTDTSGVTTQHTIIYKSSTSSDTPSVTHSDANRMAMFAAEINATTTFIGGTSDVSIDGGTWTNLVTNANTNNFTIGFTDLQNLGRSPEGTNYIDGSLADVRIYDRQLTQNEITTMYSALGQDGIVSGLLGRWIMKDEAIGQTPGMGVTSFVDSTTTSIGSDTSLTVTVPLQIDNDLLIACICPGGNASGVPAVVTDDSGDWILSNTGDTDLPSTGNTPSLWVYYKTASSEPSTYDFSIDQTCTIIGHILSYRSVASNIPETISSLNTGTTNSPISPSIAGSGDWLAVRICALDNEELPIPVTDFYPFGTNGRQATEATGVGNGCTLGTADDTDPSIVRPWSPASSDQWGCLTLRFSSNIGTASVKDVAGAVDSPHDGTVSAYPITVDSELRL